MLGTLDLVDSLAEGVRSCIRTRSRYSTAWETSPTIISQGEHDLIIGVTGKELSNYNTGGIFSGEPDVIWYTNQ